VATPAALDVALPAPAEFREATLRLTPGDRLDRELLIEALRTAGYERTETVVEVGQWSVRGGIVDIFSPAQAAPARLEFFGDEIESIRLFDPTSQRPPAPPASLCAPPLPETPEPSQLPPRAGPPHSLPPPAPPRPLSPPAPRPPRQSPPGPPASGTAPRRPPASGARADRRPHWTRRL